MAVTNKDVNEEVNFGWYVRSLVCSFIDNDLLYIQFNS
jgi:hypothetical protein